MSGKVTGFAAGVPGGVNRGHTIGMAASDRQEPPKPPNPPNKNKNKTLSKRLSKRQSVSNPRVDVSDLRAPMFPALRRKTTIQILILILYELRCVGAESASSVPHRSLSLSLSPPLSLCIHLSILPHTHQRHCPGRQDRRRDRDAAGRCRDLG